MEGLKIGGLGSGPLLKMGVGGGGVQNWPTREKMDFGAKNNKHTFFLKGGSFRAAHAEKVESVGAAKAKHGGGGALEGVGGTYPYCPNMGVPHSRGIFAAMFKIMIESRYVLRGY